ncbi:MAG TPA: hypothetical protein VIX58_01120 [Anaerolineae bacterium]
MPTDCERGNDGILYVAPARPVRASPGSRRVGVCPGTTNIGAGAWPFRSYLSAAPAGNGGLRALNQMRNVGALPV